MQTPILEEAEAKNTISSTKILSLCFRIDDPLPFTSLRVTGISGISASSNLTA